MTGNGKQINYLIVRAEWNAKSFLGIDKTESMWYTIFVIRRVT
jgi:hypothetical protein